MFRPNRVGDHAICDTRKEGTNTTTQAGIAIAYATWLAAAEDYDMASYKPLMVTDDYIGLSEAYQVFKLVKGKATPLKIWPVALPINFGRIPGIDQSEGVLVQFYGMAYVLGFSGMTAPYIGRAAQPGPQVTGSGLATASQWLDLKVTSNAVSPHFIPSYPGSTPFRTTQWNTTMVVRPKQNDVTPGTGTANADKTFQNLYAYGINVLNLSSSDLDNCSLICGMGYRIYTEDIKTLDPNL